MKSTVIEKVVVVDPGKNTVKVAIANPDYSELKSFRFPSKVRHLVTDSFVGVDGGSSRTYRVRYNSKAYLVGDMAYDAYSSDMTKSNVHHQLCIYTAVAKAIETDGQVIGLVVGFPSSDFRNTEKLNAFKSLLMGTNNGVISVEIDGRPVTFTIGRLSVYPEGLAVKPRLIGGARSVQVVDIGGQNTNYRHYGAEGVAAESYSLDEAGVNHLATYLRNEFRKCTDADIFDVDSVDFHQAIRIGELPGVDVKYLKGFTSTAEFVRGHSTLFIQDHILELMKKRGNDLLRRGTYIVFTGGGSLMFEPYIRTLVEEQNSGNFEFSTTAQWDNCISYLIRDLGERWKSQEIQATQTEFADMNHRVLQATFETDESQRLSQGYNF